MEVTREFQAGITSIARCPVPVIAAVHGHCLGGGIDLITACDVRLASADATFSIRETRIGIVADVGTLQRLPNVVTSGHLIHCREQRYDAFSGDDAYTTKLGRP